MASSRWLFDNISKGFQMLYRLNNWIKHRTRLAGTDKAALYFFIFFLVLLHSLSTAVTTQAIECSYLAEGAGEEFSAKGNCGEMIDPDSLIIKEAHLKRLSFANGPAVVIADGKVFYVSKTGKAVRTWMVDNGADYFSEGLARTVAKGKFGFIDENLDVVIPPQYDFAFPFENGHAVVCNGCILKHLDEHVDVDGGLWGTIDRTGKVLIPLEQERTKFMKFLDKKAGK